MANTFSCLNIHRVFSAKERVWVLNPDIRERLWPYMGGIAKQHGMIPKCIGGVSDHVHLLVTLPDCDHICCLHSGMQDPERAENDDGL